MIGWIGLALYGVGSLGLARACYVMDTTNTGRTKAAIAVSVGLFWVLSFVAVGLYFTLTWGAGLHKSHWSIDRPGDDEGVVRLSAILLGLGALFSVACATFLFWAASHVGAPGQSGNQHGAEAAVFALSAAVSFIAAAIAHHEYHK